MRVRRFPLPFFYDDLTLFFYRVSLLTDFERCDDYLDWELGTHGIYVEFANPALNLSPSQLPPPSTASTPSNASTSSSLSSTPAVRETYRSLTALPKLKLSLPSSANPKRLPTVLHATFLPEVAPAQGWSKVEAVDAALRKAGFKGTPTDEMRSRARVSRYQSKKIKRDYEEWQAWREGRE
jgi:AMMECR1 domain-containing protein